jgi:hypothetical protein
LVGGLLVAVSYNFISNNAKNTQQSSNSSSKSQESSVAKSETSSKTSNNKDTKIEEPKKSETSDIPNDWETATLGNIGLSFPKAWENKSTSEKLNFVLYSDNGTSKVAEIETKENSIVEDKDNAKTYRYILDKDCESIAGESTTKFVITQKNYTTLGGMPSCQFEMKDNATNPKVILYFYGIANKSEKEFYDATLFYDPVGGRPADYFEGKRILQSFKVN